MNFIDFSQLGGYRLEQPTFAKMQEAYYDILNALTGHFGITNPGKYIISGCSIDGVNITPGILFIDGHLCSFAGSAGTIASKIVKQTNSLSLEFENGTTPTVFYNYTALINESGTSLSEFIRIPSPFNLPQNIVIDANYVHTDNNFTSDLKIKLEGIEEGAEKNVQADWNMSDPTSDAYIKNKPPGRLLRALHSDTYIIGNIAGGNDDVITITFPSVGTSNYQVLPEFISNHALGPAYDNDFSYVIDDKTPTSFKICFNEISTNHTQNITMNYTLIPLT